MAPPLGNVTTDESVTYTSGNLQNPPDLRLLHYNDVYHIDPSSSEPVGGIARFQTLCNHYRDADRFREEPKLITLFSGDAFNPSLESSVTKGSHMVPILNNIGTDVACVGNHDLDFGIPQFENLTSKCNFPWLLANVLDPALGEGVPLGNAKKTAMLTSSNGIKIGVIGLVEREWLDTLNSIPPNLIYKSASATAIELIPELREQGAEIIVALSHQREPNDNKLAEKTPDGLIDIILGGHDHYYKHQIINSTHLLRSGTDFKQLSYIEVRRQPQGKRWDFHILRRDIVSEIKQNEASLALTEQLSNALKAKLDKPLGYTAAPLDARFTTVRLKESNLGNFVCDIMRSFYQADCTIIAAGTIRGDQIYPPGLLRIRDIMNCFPFEDPCVVLRIAGSAIVEALENGVSTYPALEGRFPQVSNIEFQFDPSAAPGSRIKYVQLGGCDIDYKREYTIVTRDYMARGKDGFTSLMAESEGGCAKEIVSEENGILISMLLRQYFMSIKTLYRWRSWSSQMDSHWSAVHQNVHDKHPVIDSKPASPVQPRTRKPIPEPRATTDAEASFGELDILGSDSDSELDHDDEAATDDRPSLNEREMQITRKVIRKWWRLTGLPGHPALCTGIGEAEFKADWTKAIAPRLEGRIKIVGVEL